MATDPDAIASRIADRLQRVRDAQRQQLEAMLGIAKLLAQTRYRGAVLERYCHRLGIARSDGYLLVKLAPKVDGVLAECQASGKWPSWREVATEVLGGKPRQSLIEKVTKERDSAVNELDALRAKIAHMHNRANFGAGVRLTPPGHGKFILTPPEWYAALNAEFHFTFDPCPHPLPPKWDALTMGWGAVNYVNPSFSREDGPGLTAFVRKAIAEQADGKTSVLVLPMPELLDLLLKAGAEIRRIGRLPWIDPESGARCKNPACCAMFVLRGRS
jgi:hypothetical protein